MITRIAHVVPAITVGGLWRHLDAVGRLDPTRFASLVVSIFDRDVAELVSHLEVPVTQIRMDPADYQKVEAIQAEVLRTLSDFAPSILHSYHLYSDIYSLPLVGALACSGVRAVHGITQVDLSDPLNRSAIKTDWSSEDLILMRRTAPFCSATLAVSRDLKERLVRHGFDGSSIEVVYPGVDLDRFGWRSRASTSTAGPLIGFIGRLEPVKNPALFLDVARRCLARGFAGQFWLIGDGRLRARIRQDIERLGLSDHVMLKDETSDIVPLLRALDLLVVTSYSEGLPLSVIEAMAVGVPVISSRVGGVSEAIDNGLSGFLCDLGQPEEFVDYIFHLLSHPELMGALALRAKGAVEKKFSLAVHLRSLTQAYCRLGKAAR